MYQKRKLFSVLLMLVFLTLIFGGLQASVVASDNTVPYPSESSIKIGATGTASSTYVYWVALAEVAQSHIPDVNFTVVETGATVENMGRLLQGQFDLVQTDTVISHYIWNGLGEWTQNREIRSVLPMALPAQPIFVRADSDIYSMEDLNGKPFSAGGTGSATEALWIKIFSILGVQPNLYKAGYADIADAFKEGRIVGFGKGHSGIHLRDAMVMDVETRVPVRALEFSESQLEILKEAMTEYSWVPFKSSMYTEGADDVIVPGWVLTAQTMKDQMSNEMAYWIVRTAFENKDDLIKSFIGSDFDWIEAMTSFTEPLHSGAVTYLKEIGVELPSNLVPLEYNE